MAGLPNGISCTNSQHTDGKSVSTQGKTGKDSKLGSGLCEEIGQKWSSTNSYFLCSDHSDESFFTKNREIAAKLGMKRKPKPDAVPTTDLSLADTADTTYQSLEDRAKRQVKFIYVLVFKPWSSGNS